MKKVLFLMLFLMILGAASVEAQVRIGGNAVPNAAAVLDLNATDGTNNGTKGLALPRVNLTSNTMQLTTGVVNLTGMLVYNTTATLGQIGIFYWNGATWVKASLPSTSTADSGKVLVSNGTNFVAVSLMRNSLGFLDTASLKVSPATVSFTLILDTFFTMRALPEGQWYWRVRVLSMAATDVCFGISGQGTPFAQAELNDVVMWYFTSQPLPTQTLRLRCFRPSI